jgi:glycolate oxidase FAD binding subunit
MTGGAATPVAGSTEGRMNDAVDRLRQRLGRDAVDTADTYRYAAGGVVPGCVLQPANVDAVAMAVRSAREGCLAVIPAGSATHLDVGHSPRRYDAALTTRRLERIVAHDAGDMTVTVEAGVTLAALEQVLAAQRQWLPLDPPRPDAMTIGGLIAADRSGPLRFSYGKVRDWLIGVRVVTADGRQVRGGGRVVKNVAGYDLPKLFTGSFGTLGVIVEATFKVQPMHEAEALFVWPAASLEQALAAAGTALASGVIPTLVETINEAAAESLGLEVSAAVIVGCAGSPAHLEEQARRLSALSAGAAERLGDEYASSLRRALSDFSQSANEDGVVARISALPTGLAALLPQVEAAAAARRIVVEIAAHAGSGVAWCQFLGAPSVDALAELADWLRALGRERGAWVVYESLPAALRGRVDPWGYSEPALRLMGGVKRALDPAGVFSPGRFVGGI